MERIHIPSDANSIVSTSSKGDQSKWLIKGKWTKQNTRGYEDIAEYVASLILKASTLDPSQYVHYEPCETQFNYGQVTKGCYSLDFRGTEQQEVSALYEGPPFIDEEKLRELLELTPHNLGRAYDVLQMQLCNPVFEKLLIRGAK